MLETRTSVVTLECNPKFGQLAAALIAASLAIGLNPSMTDAQSTDRYSPTPLTTTTLSGRGLEGQDQVYYYRFTAKPGEVKVTLDLQADNVNGNSITTEVSLQTPDGNELQSLSGFATQGEASHTVKKIQFASQTPTILVLTLTGGSTAGYTYQIKIDGQWLEQIRGK